MAFAIDLFLPVERQMIFVFADDHLREQASAGQSFLDQTRWQWRDHNALRIGILGANVEPLDEPRRQKLSLFCNVPKEHIISAPDVDSVYDVPLNFEQEHYVVL